MTPKETLDFVNNKDLLKEGEVWKQHPIYTKYYGSNMGRIKYFNLHNKEMIKIQNLDKKRIVSLFVYMEYIIMNIMEYKRKNIV